VQLAILHKKARSPPADSFTPHEALRVQGEAHSRQHQTPEDLIISWIIVRVFYGFDGTHDSVAKREVCG
jgi:hypothetical protein